MPVSKLAEIQIHTERRTHTHADRRLRSRSAGNPCKYANDLEPRKQLTLFTGCLRLLSLFIGFFHKPAHTHTHTQIHTHADRVGRTHLKQVDCLACVWCESGVGDSAQLSKKERKKKERKGDSKRLRERKIGLGERGKSTTSRQIRKLQQVGIFLLRGAHRAYAQSAHCVISGQLTAMAKGSAGREGAAWAVFYLINELARLPIVRLI